MKPKSQDNYNYNQIFQRYEKFMNASPTPPPNPGFRKLVTDSMARDAIKTIVAQDPSVAPENYDMTTEDRITRLEEQVELLWKIIESK